MTKKNPKECWVCKTDGGYWKDERWVCWSCFFHMRNEFNKIEISRNFYKNKNTDEDLMKLNRSIGAVLGSLHSTRTNIKTFEKRLRRRNNGKI